MESGVNSFLIRQGYSKKLIGLAFIIVLIVLICYSVYFFFYYSKPCGTSECFIKSMESCKRVSWIKEDEQASWSYTISGKQDKNCEVIVKLLRIKQGLIENEKLEGKEMICIVEQTSTTLPGEDISRCSGKLKEELQDIIIQRMHNYLLENIGDLKEEFANF